MNDLNIYDGSQPAQAHLAEVSSQVWNADNTLMPDHSDTLVAATQYSRTAKAFHWITFFALVGLFALGWYMTTLELSPLVLKLYTWHKWLGITVLALTIMRLLWRVAHPAPVLPYAMNPFLRFAAYSVHATLYFFLFAMPLIGWARSSATGSPVVLFGILPLPDFVPQNETLADTLEWAHWAGGWLFALVIIGHIGAAILHHTLERDNILRRILP